MAAPILTPARMAEWLGVLDKIDVSITHALDQTAEYEKALATISMAPTAPEIPADAIHRGFRLHLDAAGRLAEAVEGLVAADEGETRAWAGLATQIGERLARPVGRI
jgi:hypothetical protein